MEPVRPFSKLDWHLTPEPVREYIRHLERSLNNLKAHVETLDQRLEKLEVKNQKNSHNSSKPPSSDSPYTKKKRKQKKSKRAKGGQKGHQAHQQQLLEPTRVVELMPQGCCCGCTDFGRQSPKCFHTMQHVELPPIELEVTHFERYQCRCPHCGKLVKAKEPDEAKTGGYGPRLSALIVELSGIKAMSRVEVKKLCESVLNLPIATGTIQKIIDRGSAALSGPYEKIADTARREPCNYIDETSWWQETPCNGFG